MTRPDLTAACVSVSAKKRKSRREVEELTVRSSSDAFLGSGSGLLAAASSTLLHVLIHTTSGFGFLDELLSSLLVETSTVLDGVKSLVEVAGDGLIIDLEVKVIRRQCAREKRENREETTHFTTVGGDDGGAKALDVLD